MGVEKFFNTLLSSYKSKLITTFNTTNGDILFFDFAQSQKLFVMNMTIN
jgi:hypothetical protein